VKKVALAVVAAAALFTAAFLLGLRQRRPPLRTDEPPRAAESTVARPEPRTLPELPTAAEPAELGKRPPPAVRPPVVTTGGPSTAPIPDAQLPPGFLAARARRKEIQDALSSFKPAVERCYARELARRRDGRVIAEFEIVAEKDGGRVESAAVKQSTFDDPRGDECVQQALAGAQFPSPPDGKMTVQHPFWFTNDEARKP
jgi:hypothetical protein